MLTTNEGVLASARGDTAEALRRDEAALALRERALGAARPVTAVSLYNVAADTYAAGTTRVPPRSSTGLPRSPSRRSGRPTRSSPRC